MKTHFISGHGDVSANEFWEHYVPDIDRAIKNGDSFVIGDFQGADLKAQVYLHFRGITNVTVYHMFVSPRYNAGGFPVVGGFTTDEERDAAMTNASDVDIAWIRKGKEKSGTQKNIDRRTK